MVPDDADCFRWASVNAWCLTGFGFACGAGVLDFFAVLLCDCGDCFVLQVDEFSYKFNRFFWANSYASAASAAFV
jgi:hypothetical protein